MDRGSMSSDLNFHPKIIGGFSIDRDNKFRDDRSQLRYFVPPPQETCHLDLKKGLDKWIRYEYASEKAFLNDVLQWIMRHPEQFMNVTDGARPSPRFESLNTDFICKRGLLARILRMPYERSADLRIAVIKARGTYFMYQIKPEESMTERQKQMSFWGYKFEQYVTAGGPESTPNTDDAVNNNEEYICVARSRIGNHSLVYAGETDCVDPDEKEEETFMELKTNRHLDEKSRQNFYRLKFHSVWAQSILMGIKRVMFGFRNDDGIVERVKTYKVLDMPSEAKHIKNPWMPEECYRSLNSFLDWIKKTMPKDNERFVQVFYWKPTAGWVCEKTGDQSDSQFFLPQWFLNWNMWDKHFPSLKRARPVDM